MDKVIVVAALVVLSACSDDDSGDGGSSSGGAAGSSGGAGGGSSGGSAGDAGASGGSAGTDGGASDASTVDGGDGGLSASVRVTPENGGTVSVGGATVNVPGGAVAEATTITVRILGAAGLPGLPNQFAPVGPPVALLPHGSIFSQPVAITIGHSGSTTDRLDVFRLDDEADTSWEVVDQTSFSAAAVSFETTRFSIVQPGSGSADAGPTTTAPGDVTNIYQFAETGSYNVADLAIGGSGNAVVAGTTVDDLGDGSSDGMVRKVNPAGSELWYHRVQSDAGQDDNVRAVAVDGTDDVAIAGTTRGALDDGSNAGLIDVFVRKLDGGSSTELWTHQLGTANNDGTSGVATDSDQHVVVAASVDGLVGAEAFGSWDGLVRKLDGATGEALWTVQFGTPEWDETRAIAVDAANNVLVAGTTEGDLAETNAGGSDGFVRKIDASGSSEPMWTHQFGAAGHECVTGVAVDASGNVYVAGFKDSDTCLDFGRPAMNGFVMKLDSNGNELWTRDISTPAEDRIRRLALDGSGNVLVAGQTAGSLTGTNTGQDDAFVRKLGPTGDTVWTQQLGTDVQDRAYGVGADTSGNVIVAGHTTGTFGTISGGPWSVFVAWLAP